jgi:hypothetical protein
MGVFNKLFGSLTVRTSGVDEIVLLPNDGSNPPTVTAYNVTFGGKLNLGYAYVGTGGGALTIATTGLQDININSATAVKVNSNLLVGTSVSNTAKLSIKGSGATSATTSLLVQDSANSDAFKITDDHSATFTNESGATFTVRNAAGSRAFTISGINKDVNTSGNITGTAFFALGISISSVGTGIIRGSNTATIDMNGDNMLIYSRTATASTLRLLTGVNGTMYVSGHSNLATAVNASAQLQIDSTTQGFLPPRMTTAQKLAIGTPAEGLMVYDTDLKRPCFYNATSWITL